MAHKQRACSMVPEDGGLLLEEMVISFPLAKTNSKSLASIAKTDTESHEIWHIQ